MSSSKSPNKTQSHQILRAKGSGSFVIEPDNLDRFVLTQPQVVEACVQQDALKDLVEDFANLFKSFLEEIRAWANRHERISECVIGSRSSDIMVLVLSSDEDEDGTLHNEMSKLEIELFHRIPMPTQWILFRRSEKSGFDEFSETTALAFGDKDAEREEA